MTPRYTAIAALAILTGACIPAAPPAPVAVSPFTNTMSDGQVTQIRKVSLDDGVDCYTWNGQLSCVRRTP